MSELSFEVSIDYPLYQSNKGLYYIGQTPILDGQSGTAFAALSNPHNSHSLAYVNAITITNLSDISLFAEFYLGQLQYHYRISDLVRSANTYICPPSSPTANIEYIAPAPPVSIKGVPFFSRIVPAQSTLVVDGGQMILGPKQSLGVSIGDIDPVAFDSVRFAFGWSEREIC